MICEANNQHMLVKVHCRQVHLIVAHFYPPPHLYKKKITMTYMYQLECIQKTH